MIAILVAAILLKKLHLNDNFYKLVFLEGSLRLILSIGIALLSYHFWEARFLRLKERFARITKK